MPFLVHCVLKFKFCVHFKVTEMHVIQNLVTWDACYVTCVLLGKSLPKYDGCITALFYSCYLSGLLLLNCMCFFFSTASLPCIFSFYKYLGEVTCQLDQKMEQKQMQILNWFFTCVCVCVCVCVFVCGCVCMCFAWIKMKICRQVYWNPFVSNFIKSHNSIMILLWHIPSKLFISMYRLRQK